MTQPRFAAEAGISMSTLTRWLSEERPSIQGRNISGLAYALSIDRKTIKDFLDESNPAPRSLGRAAKNRPASAGLLTSEAPKGRLEPGVRAAATPPGIAGRFTKEEATLVERAVREMFEALSPTRQAIFLGRYKAICRFLAAAKKAAPDSGQPGGGAKATGAVQIDRGVPHAMR